MNYKVFNTLRKISLSILVLLFLSVGKATGQTLDETEAWIIKQTEVNRAELKHSIDRGILISHLKLGMNVGGLFGGAIEKGIPIGKVTQIGYTHTPDYLSYTMTCKSPCAFLLEEPDTMRPKFLFEIYKKVDAVYVERMNKALAHLVRLHGGHATLVKASPVKEAF
jgi:hypothetical protein